MKKSLIIFLLPLFGFVSCNKKNILPDPKPINLTEKAQALVSADNRFGLELFKKLTDTATAEHNIIISPLSVSQALSMTYNGAAGDTKTAFDNTLHFENMTLDDVNISSGELISALLTVDPKVTINIANSIWYKNGFEVKNDFVQRNKTYYNAQIRALDFSSGQSVNTINNWVSENTKGHITKIVEQLNPLDRMLLINAIYFKGNWRNMFHKDETASKPFYLENGQTVYVDMMHTTGKYSYYENNLLEVLEMPYGRGNYSMAVLLPKSGYKVKDIIDTLSAESWQQWQYESYGVNDVPLYFPKFKFAYEQSLVNTLKALGMEIAFGDNADFSGINDKEPLKISNVLHKAYIKVDEEGTEAAAVTSVTVGTTSVGPGEPFNVDHPFVFIIKEKYTKAILFAGVVANPSEM